MWRVVLAFVVGKRTQENADLLLDRVKDVTDGHIPFFTSDQLPEYDDAGFSLNAKGIAGDIRSLGWSLRPICCTLKWSKCESMAG